MGQKFEKALGSGPNRVQMLLARGSLLTSQRIWKKLLWGGQEEILFCPSGSQTLGEL